MTSLIRPDEQRIAEALIRFELPNVDAATVELIASAMLVWCKRNHVDITTSEIVFHLTQWFATDGSLPVSPRHDLARRMLAELIDSTTIVDRIEFVLDGEPVAITDWLALVKLLRAAL